MDITTEKYFSRYKKDADLFEDLDVADSFAEYFIDIQLEVLNSSRMRNRFIGSEEEVEDHVRGKFRSYFEFIREDPSRPESMSCAYFLYKSLGYSDFIDKTFGEDLTSIDRMCSVHLKCHKCKGVGCSYCGETGKSQDQIDSFDQIGIEPRELPLWTTKK